MKQLWKSFLQCLFYKEYVGHYLHILNKHWNRFYNWNWTDYSFFIKCYFKLFKKNTLTGPANCKKTTRNAAHLSLCAKSRKTNDLMIQSQENGQKLQFGHFFDDFEVKYLQIANFFEKWFHSNWRSYLVWTSGQTPKKMFEPFLRKISKCLNLG